MSLSNLLDFNRPVKKQLILFFIVMGVVLAQPVFAISGRFDVDGSDTVNSTDAMLTLRNSLGLDMGETNWTDLVTTGDVDCNGSSSSTDAMLTLRYSLGLDMGGTNWCKDRDEQFTYQNNSQLETTLVGDDITIERTGDNKVLIDTIGKEFFVDKSEGNLTITHTLVEKNGGFDVEYTVANVTGEKQKMPDLQIPGIELDDNKLDILNSYRLYMEDGRQLSDDSSYSGHRNDRFIVALYHGSYTRPGDDTRGQSHCIYDDVEDVTVCRYKSDLRYGGATTSAYSPVVVAKDDDFSVGTSLNYDFLEYSRDTSDYNGTYKNTRRDYNHKLYPFMHIVRDGDTWTYEYSFIQYDHTEQHADGYVPAGETYQFVIPVRFSVAEKWIFTVHPYKTHLTQLYGETVAPVRTPAPVLWVNLAFYGIYAEQNHNPRGWTYNYQLIDDGSPVELPIEEITAGLSNVMASHGFEDVMLHSLSGEYPVHSGHEMYTEIPYQFVDGRPDYMKGGALTSALHTFTNAGQKYSFWWGISGNMPVDENDDVLAADVWLPDGDIPFQLLNNEHKIYAEYQLDKALEVSPAGIGFDAYGRMEEKTAMQWLDEMSVIIDNEGTNTEMWLEEQLDFKHKKAGIIRQGYRDAREIEHNHVKKPPELAQYLNSDAKILILLSNGAMREMSVTPEEHVQDLVKMGYTPFIANKANITNDQVYATVTDKIIGNADSFYDFSGLDKSIYTCLDGIDNDGDGDVDWPYDDSCSSAMVNSE